MTGLFRYNLAIGRESEAGIDSRLGKINTGLASAISLVPPVQDGHQLTDALVDPQ